MDGVLKFLDRKDVQLLQPKMRLARAKPGQQLVKEGRLPIGLFIIRNGTVDVRRARGAIEVPIATLGSGDVFGETAFLQKQPASASVYAKTALDLAIYTPDRLAPLFEQHPGLFAHFFQSIALILSRRLRAFNGQVGDNKLNQDRFGDLPNWEII